MERLADLTEKFVAINCTVKHESACLLNLSYYLDFLDVPNVKAYEKLLFEACQFEQP